MMYASSSYTEVAGPTIGTLMGALNAVVLAIVSIFCAVMVRQACTKRRNVTKSECH